MELCVAYVLLTLSRVEEAVAILDKAKQILQNGSIASSHVYSRYYKALSELYQVTPRLVVAQIPQLLFRLKKSTQNSIQLHYCTSPILPLMIFQSWKRET